MREADRNKLWDRYHVAKTPELREQLILEYANVVNLVAGRLSMYLGYTVEYDDLVGYGIFGLIDAIDKYDMAKNVKFETYASLRIRGAILDQIRKMDWIPRTLRQKQKRMDTAVAKLGNCQIYHTAYSGTGTTITESNPKTFTFPHQPKMMMFFGSGNKRFWAIRGMDYVFVGNYESYNLRWEGKTVSLYSTNTNLDMKDSTYYVLALLDMTQ